MEKEATHGDRPRPGNDLILHGQGKPWSSSTKDQEIMELGLRKQNIIFVWLCKNTLQFWLHLHLCCFLST